MQNGTKNDFSAVRPCWLAGLLRQSIESSGRLMAILFPTGLDVKMGGSVVSCWKWAWISFHVFSPSAVVIHDVAATL